MTRRGARDPVVVADLDAVLVRRGHDLLACTLLRRGALEVGLVPARHGVADMRLVVDRQVALAVPVDVGEVALLDVRAAARGELSDVGLLSVATG